MKPWDFEGKFFGESAPKSESVRGPKQFRVFRISPGRSEILTTDFIDSYGKLKICENLRNLWRKVNYHHQRWWLEIVHLGRCAVTHLVEQFTLRGFSVSTILPLHIFLDTLFIQPHRTYAVAA